MSAVSESFRDVRCGKQGDRQVVDEPDESIGMCGGT